MFLRPFRQRRRFLLGTIFIIIAALAAILSGGGQGFGLDPADLQTWVAVVLTALIVMIPLILVLTYLLPDMRNAPEVVLLSLAAAAVLNVLLPGRRATGGC